MNIFAVDKDPEVAACCLQQKHQKMILETAQILSTAHVVLDGKKVAYGATHKNHPSCVWVRDSIENYNWLVEYGLAATAEFKRRSGREHASGVIIKQFLRKHPKSYDSRSLTPVRLAIADHLKINSGETWAEVIAAYKYYYSVDKLFFEQKDGSIVWNSWMNSDPPEWFVSFWLKFGMKVRQVTPDTISVRF